MPLPTWMTASQMQCIHPAVAIKDVVMTRRPTDEGESANIPSEIPSVYLGTMYTKQDKNSHSHLRNKEVRTMVNVALFSLDDVYWIGACITETTYGDPERGCIACIYHDRCGDHATPFEPKRPAFDDYGNQELGVPETTLRNTIFAEAQVFFNSNGTGMWAGLQAEQHGWFVPDLYHVLDNGDHPFGSYAMARQQHPSGLLHEVWHIGEWTLPIWSFNHDAIEAALAPRSRGAPFPAQHQTTIDAFLDKHCPKLTVVPRV
ncbi:hypothetical protein HBH82_108010 [Parastagonospora nodorum]|nr:hypothetical protein HBH82_108010 [Parastagonospora nodorum]KAH4658723.1 hypothetical protein HBH78_237660 [Parastagonospora nodorum]KAH4697345.1 hypothetical protein HBH67_181080 [Parastagonospora nodorum]KAH4765419.1 hypothetical protein HBH63_177940 [Parastagonospora nodorum]KAH4792382.1 hypothetical protein HBH62_026530 [Parastagonospora nodorum]